MTCFDISSSVEYGDVTYSNSSRYLGTTATVTCDTGSSMSVPSGAAATLTCVAGFWDADLPTCSQGKRELDLSRPWSSKASENTTSQTDLPTCSQGNQGVTMATKMNIIPNNEHHD